jgi:hypothetical protein
VISRHDETLWSTVKTNRQLSALRQIEAAVDHMYAGQFECAVTLALAAEDHMPRSDAVYLQNELEKRVSKKGMSTFNLLRNWLKHHIEPDEFEFSDFEAAIALVRATSKFFATYRTTTPKLEGFVSWCRSKKLIQGRDNQ